MLPRQLPRQQVMHAPHAKFSNWVAAEVAISKWPASNVAGQNNSLCRSVWGEYKQRNDAHGGAWNSCRLHAVIQGHFLHFLGAVREAGS